MNFCFYQAIDRIPLGIAVTLEFVGPLGIALLGSRRVTDLLWVSLAAAGIVLLAPGIGEDGLDAVGVAFALGAGVLWAAYITLSVRVGRAYIRPHRPRARDGGGGRHRASVRDRQRRVGAARAGASRRGARRRRPLGGASMVAGARGASPNAGARVRRAHEPGAGDRRSSSALSSSASGSALGPSWRSRSS